MKTSCSSWSYHRAIAAGAMDLTSFVHECAAIGLDGVELLGGHFPDTERETLIELKRTCAERYLTIAMVSADGHLTVGDDAAREAEVEAIRAWVEVAAFLGAPRVRFFCGSGAELTAGGADLYGKVVAAVKRIAVFGAERGILMALENHGDTTADQLLRLHADVAGPYLKFTLDTGNFPPASRVGPQTYDSIERCAPHAAIVHAKFFDVNADGSDAEFDWHRIRAILTQAGFRGFLSIEYEGADDDEVAVLRRIAPFAATLR